MKNIEEASININNQNPVIALKAAIVCTNTQDKYSAGFRNGVRYAISILTGDEPKYENVIKSNFEKEHEKKIKILKSERGHDWG